MSAITVQGRLVTPTQIELSEPVVVNDPAVEVVIRPRQEQRHDSLVSLLMRMAAMPSRGRSKEDIDRQIREEREGWDDRR